MKGRNKEKNTKDNNVSKDNNSKETIDNSNHSKNDEFKCSTCRNMYISMNDLNKHIQDKHIEENCINCNKSFNKKDLFNHIKTRNI